MKLVVNDNQFKLKICFTQKQIKEGMMGKKFDDFDGMLFILSPGSQSFWMYGCIIPLDIIFINDDEIVKIYSNCIPCNNEPCDRYISNHSNLVLELPGGSCDRLGINVGDKINLNLN